MSKNRGKRGSGSKSVFAVQLKVRDTEQLNRTLNLLGVKDEKPVINDVVYRMIPRLEEEHRLEMLEMVKRWHKEYGWPSDAMLYDCFGGEYPADDEYGYDPYEEIFDGVSSKSSRKLKALNKKLFKKSKKHDKKYGKHRGSEDVDDYWSNRHSMFRNGEWSDDDLDNEDNYDEPYKVIKFYEEIENEMGVREFYSLKEFNEFCEEKGYNVSTTDYNNLVNWSVIHCCLDPISLKYGENDIITDNSYGALYWTVSDDMTKHSENNSSSAAESRTFTD